MKKIYSYKCPHCGFVAMFEEERTLDDSTHFCPFCSEPGDYIHMKKIHEPITEAVQV